LNAHEPDLSPLDYQQIEEFRYQLRSFLNFSETAAREAGLEPQQHQALLVIKAGTKQSPPSVGDIARRLLLKHHSAVGLIDRLQALGLIARTANPDDARQVLVQLTKKGERILRKLSIAHRTELEQMAPALIRILESITQTPAI
jgi:DNA-binding MarR family transcriptional regulator